LGEQTNEKQREFVTAIVKIVFTVALGGLAGGRLFSQNFTIWHYIVACVFLLRTFTLGLLLQKEGK